MTMRIENNEIIVLNPASLKEVGRVEVSSKTKVMACLNSSKKYQQWTSLSLNQRCKLITRYRKAIVKNSDLLKKTLKSETGKKDFDIFVEYFTFLEHLRHIPKIAKASLRRESRNSGLMKNKKSYVVYEPLGVAGIISPWNYPLATPMISSIEALMAGNNVILKPSEHTPLTTRLAKKIWDEHIGYEEAFQVINGCGDIGGMLVESKNTDIICFTGSTKVGKLIAEQCGKDLKPVLLELGGKDPMIVLKDANINRAIESAVFGGLSNAGQTCISTEEIFVEVQIWDRFTKIISDRMKHITSGGNKNNELGPMIVPENRDKVEAHIKEVQDSCTIIRGNSDGEASYLSPALIIDPPSDSRVVNEETFGPVLTVRPFNDENELFDLVHKTGYGLSASIFGKNRKRIERISSQIKTGNISVNDVMTHYGIASLPFGGEGQSGLGKSHGPEGLRSLCRVKSIVVNRFDFIDEPWWFGRPRFIEKMLEKMVDIIYR